MSTVQSNDPASRLWAVTVPEARDGWRRAAAMVDSARTRQCPRQVMLTLHVDGAGNIVGIEIPEHHGRRVG